MKVVGVTGGIGSGKTTVCKVFEALGIPVYYADLRAKELMESDEGLRNKLINVFGTKTYLNGKLNRAYLAQQIFNSKEKLSVINGLVHPVVAEDFDVWVENNQKSAYVLKEAAILFESGAYQDVDISVLVIASEEIRLERVMARDGSEREDVLKRMNNQWTQERKAKMADYIIKNEGTELLIPQVLELHKQFSRK